VVRDVLVDELVLAAALNHAVPLFSKPPYYAEHRYPGSRCLAHVRQVDRIERGCLLEQLDLFLVEGLGLLEQDSERLDNIIDGDEGTRPADSCAAMEHDLAVHLCLRNVSVQEVLRLDPRRGRLAGCQLFVRGQRPRPQVLLDLHN